VTKLKDPKDLLLAAIFAAFAAVTFIEGRELEMATARAMGPGYFPKMLALILLLIACALAIRSFFGNLAESKPKPSIRVIASIIGAALLFGILIRPAGLVISIIVSVIVSGFASDGFQWKSSLLTGAVLAAGSSIIFIYLLGQPIPLFGEFF